MHEIEILERQWRRYRLKKATPYILGGVALLLGSLVLWFLTETKKISHPQAPFTSTEASHAKPIVSNPHVQPTPLSTPPEKPKQAGQPLAQTRSTPTQKSLLSKESFLTKEPTLTLKPHLNPSSTHPVLHTGQESPSAKEKKAKKSAAIADAPQQKDSQHTSSHTLLVRPKHLNRSLIYLVERFKKNPNPKLALYIAQSYFKKGNYLQAIEWSVAASEIDPSDPQSWLLFAKAKVRLGKKGEAIHALHTYQQQYHSDRIAAYLRRLQKGSR